MKSILILLHCESNTGYAIAHLESVFFQVALRLTAGDVSRIHFGYPSMGRGKSNSLPSDFNQYLVIDTKSRDPDAFNCAERYVCENDIDTVLGFDQEASAPIYKYLRRGGVRTFFAYWGAPISSLSGPWKLFLKRVEFWIRGRHGPDHFIFESKGMARTATHGRGIPQRNVHVVNLGVDVGRFRPDASDGGYIHRVFALDPKMRVFFFSGHMEPRKGVRIILRAAELLARRRCLVDWHVVLLGNQPGEKEKLLEGLNCQELDKYVTFGGYRQDIEVLHRGCYAGIIASTGWDSLTMSSIEMQSSALPLLVSNLPGLNEAVEDQVTGYLFPPGDAVALSRLMGALLQDTDLRGRLAKNARHRVVARFSRLAQVQNLVDLVERYS